MNYITHPHRGRGRPQLARGMIYWNISGWTLFGIRHQRWNFRSPTFGTFSTCWTSKWAIFNHASVTLPRCFCIDRDRRKEIIEKKTREKSFSLPFLFVMKLFFPKIFIGKVIFQHVNKFLQTVKVVQMVFLLHSIN